jgi:predicted RNase H-like HicB family nuclease
MSLASERTTTLQATDLIVTIILEKNNRSRFSATTLEFPDCRVEAATREQAIANLQQQLSSRLEKAEIISLTVQLPQKQPAENPWNKVVGVFSDDPDFEQVQEYIQSYRDEVDAEDVPTGLYERDSLRLMGKGKLDIC